MKYLITLLLLSMFMSCNKDDNSDSSTYISTSLEFSFEDEQGNDLLNPNFKNAFNPKDVELFVIKDGVKKIIANYDSPHFLLDERGFYVLCLSLANDTTYLKLSEAITDTITSHCKSGSNYKYLIEVWYNKDLIWNQNDETSLVKVIK